MTVRVLLIEDDAGDAELVRELLADARGTEFAFERVETLAQAETRLPAGGFDVVLLDLTLPDGRGLESLSRVQTAAPEAPVVVVTGLDDEATALAAVGRGAQDYLVKGATDGPMTARVIRYAVERKRAEAQLRERTLILEHALEGIARIDTEQRFVSVNDTFAAMLGYAPDELVGRAWQMTVRAEDAGELAAALRGVRERGKAEVEVRGLRRDGSTPYQRLLLVADAPGFYCFARDIDEQRRLRDQLVFAGRMASVGTLAAGVAHEINNPLAYVISNIDFVSRVFGELSAAWLNHGKRPTVRETAELQDVLSEARQGADRVRRIVRDLLTVARPERRQAGLVDVENVLEAAISIAGNEIRHRARLTRTFGRVPPILGEESRLGQVFLNLLMNAAQAIPEGNADRHEIAVRTTTDPSGDVLVEVRDTGSGIAAGHLPRIFDPFFTTKPVGEGTGLGLSICHGIIGAMGGSVTAESVEGQGSVFRVRLPSAHTPALEAAPRRRPVRLDREPEPRRGRVLIVDDEPMFLSSAKRSLSPEFEVVTAASGADAIRHLGDGAPFDVMLCDLMMPDMSGIELFDKIARRWPEAIERVVFLTGGAFTAAARDFLEQIPNARLEKPVEEERLRAVLRSFMA